MTFFNIYYSPLVQLFSLRGNTCSIDWNHAPEYNTVIGRLNTNVEISKYNSHRIYSTRVGTHTVTFTFSGDIGGTADVDFTVDYSFDRPNLPKREKVAITRWLLAVWQRECANYSVYKAMPAGNTENGVQWRDGYYAKFGFKRVDAKYMILEN